MIVGNSQHGRNWQLNYRIGQGDRQLAFSLETIAAYSGTFEPVVSFSTIILPMKLKEKTWKTTYPITITRELLITPSIYKLNFGQNCYKVN